MNAIEESQVSKREFISHQLLCWLVCQSLISSKKELGEVVIALGWGRHGGKFHVWARNHFGETCFAWWAS